MIGSAEVVGPEERISRLIYDHGDFTESTGHIDFRVFLPPKKGEFTQEVSVARTEALSEEAVWSLVDGNGFRAGAVARGDFRCVAVRATEVRGNRLDVVPQEPPQRHAVIIGWPPQGESDLRKQLAIELRKQARPHLQIRSNPSATR